MDSRRNIEAAHARITSWTDRDEDTGCLVSRYSTGSHGYAQAWDGVTVVLAHRIVWEWHHGPIPAGMTVDHADCHNRKCVEITHLRLLPNLENARRNQPGRNWELGTCIAGHGPEFWKPRGPERKKGYCSECRRERRASGRYSK